MPNPSKNPLWQQLATLQRQLLNVRLSQLFRDQPDRFEHYSLLCHDLLIDYSKNFVDEKVLACLLDLARQQALEAAIQQLFRGGTLSNGLQTIPYTALRDRAPTPLSIAGEDICSQIRDNLFHMSRICRQIRSWNWRGFTDKPISDVVTLGVGGAATDAQAVHKALASYQTNSLRIHFVCNSGSAHFTQLLEQLQPDTTLFIVSSKSFATRETLDNARFARSWIMNFANNEAALSQHFIGITSNQQGALDFGIPADNILAVWNWLPGRYSLWAAAGLPVALAIGMERFEELLAGAALMDQHFLRADLRHNGPVLLAMLSIWYTNFWQANHHALLPYSESLELFPGLVQHCLMEANGKSVDLEGNPVDYQTAPVIWGTAGNSSQHTYFQLLHQGTHNIPAEFIVPAWEPIAGCSQSSFNQFLAQSAALMLGDSESGNSPLANDQILRGNKPSTSIVMKTLSPSSLGQLLALYEHIAYTRAIIWNINPFTHWGTELSKRYTANFSEEHLNSGLVGQDGSSRGLLRHFRQWQEDSQCRESTLDSVTEEPSTFF